MKKVFDILSQKVYTLTKLKHADLLYKFALFDNNEREDY